MTYQLEQARLTLTHEKTKERTLYRQVNNHKMWHARQLAQVQTTERSIQGLDQVVALLKEQDTFEREAFSMTLPVVVHPYATPPRNLAVDLTLASENPYATPPSNMAVDLTLASEEDHSANGEVRDEGVTTTANLKTTGLNHDDYDDAKDKSPFPPNDGDDDNNEIV